MKVLLIILIAMRIAVLLKKGVRMHKEDGKFANIIAAGLMSALWVASLVWLINL